MNLRYDCRPVPGTSFEDLDRRRLVNYFRDLRRQEFPDYTDEDGWIRLLVNTEFMVESRGRAMASAAGLLLFGRNPNRFLPHAGVSAAAYSGTEKDYEARERMTLRGAAVSLAFQRTEQDGSLYPRRDYRYVEANGLGVPRKIVRGMRAHNGTEPDLIEEEDRFTVRLWKQPRQAASAASVAAERSGRVRGGG